MQPQLFFSSLLQTIPRYKPSAERLFNTLESNGIEYQLLEGTKDIWLRDFMPVKTKLGKFVSFKYNPFYLNNYPELRTDYKNDVSKSFSFTTEFSDINLDGGNIVFSPSKEKVIISERVFSENPDYNKFGLFNNIESLLEAQVIVIPSLERKYDMTGHADGMVRFINESTVLGNRTNSKIGLEQQIKKVLNNNGIKVMDFPFFSSPSGSAKGCYINFLETEKFILLPVFGFENDNEAFTMAKNIFDKKVLTVNINEIAKDGGVLNCISWETA